MTNIFLSYSRKDVKAADRIQRYLEARGLTVFRDIEMGAGENWVKKTSEMLRSTRVVLVLWSRNSAASDNVSHEAMIAKELGKLVPAMIDDVQGMDLPMGLSVVQSADLRDWREPNSNGLERLAAAIEHQLKEPLKLGPKRKQKSPLPSALTGVATAVILGVAGYVFLTSQPPTAPPVKTASATPLSAPILTTDARDAADIDPPPAGDDLVADVTAVPGPHVTMLDLSTFPLSVQTAVNDARLAESAALAMAEQAGRAADEARAQQAAAKSGATGTAQRRMGANLVEGQIVDGRFNGHAVVTVEDGDFKGDSYLGQIANEMNQGLGVYEYSPANPKWVSVRYRGEWNKGTLNGLGVVEFRGGGTYAGYFRDGKMSGIGVYRDSEVVYEGGYEGGRKHGVGIRWTASAVDAGTWVDGKFAGRLIE